MRLNRLAALSVAAVIAAVGIAHSAGYFPNWPLANGPAYCGGTSTGVGGQVCSQQVPAGPALTGLEVIPMDTRASAGAQSVLLSMQIVGAAPMTYPAGSTTANNTFTVNPSSPFGGVIFVASGAISPTTVTLHSSPIDGQRFKISSTQTIATLTVTTANGGATHSISNAPTALTVSTTGAYGYEFIYDASNTTWRRLQ